MPNQRRAGQMFFGFQADLELVRELDRARGRRDRPQSICEAIAQKLQGQGIGVREDLIYPPERADRVEVSYSNGEQEEEEEMKTLIECPACGQAVSASAANCPHCGEVI